MDPVTGRVYTLAVTDMALPGAFPLVIERAYSSAQRDLDYGLGHGWNHSLEVKNASVRGAWTSFSTYEYEMEWIAIRAHPRASGTGQNNDWGPT